MKTKSFKRKLINSFHEKGLFDYLRRLRPNSLTVLNYHRINDFSSPAFDKYLPNISATKDGFAEQMDFMRGRFNFISIEDLWNGIQGRQSLPEYAALITFDDGYQDNLINAFPILTDRNIPACIFVTTDFIGSSHPFYWDLIAYYFHHTLKKEIELPIIGKISLENKSLIPRLLDSFIGILKALPEIKKNEIVSQLSKIFNVVAPESAFINLPLTWDQVRYLSKNGITIGSHTKSHPILTSISPEEVYLELRDSKLIIEEEIGKRVLGFAYPNGSKSDYNREIIEIVQKTGYDLAFNLVSGRQSYTTLLNNPFSIQRIFIGKKDILPRFVAKISGL